MARGPNAEQQKAIAHNGGVLLSAGAGSGKTFVLVEHISYLINEFIKNNGTCSKNEFRQKLRSYLSSIIMMTFTKKAAGELSLRLKAKMEGEREKNNSWHWDIVVETISVMTVSTIHGVCHKLLSSGIIPDFDPQIEISFNIDQGDKINNLFSSWYGSLSEEQKNSEIIKIFLSNRRSLVASLIGIFGDPSIRIMWRNLSVDDCIHDDLKSFFDDVLKLNEIEHVFSFNIDLDSYDRTAKWFDYLKQFESLSASTPLESVTNMNLYVDFFNNYSGIRKPTKKYDETVIDYFEQTIELRDLLNEIAVPLNAFDKHRDGVFKDWIAIFKNIVDYIELNYKNIKGLNFSDLEYYVLIALQKDDVVKRIAERFRYYIVDEFQDTSFIQYEILRKLIEGNHDKLFCVGDKKQAIYGFRGGELGVFEECSKNIKNNLSLKNNYRSKKQIINFNNELFSFLFKKGLEYSGDDPFKVEVEFQECPLDIVRAGDLKRILVDVSGEEKEKLSTTEMNRIEGNSIFKEIQNVIREFPDETIAVLYSKLAPSKILISKLIKSGIGFTAQMKVPLSQDPLMGIFKILVEVALVSDTESLEHSALHGEMLIKGYFKYLKIEVHKDIKISILNFLNSIDTLGVKESFSHFIFWHGISNSNYSNNISQIETICKLGLGNLEKILNLLDDSSDGSYSIDFQTGKASKKIQIMTVHASKGLEFDHVFLAGIHTNGVLRVGTDYFGKMPGSFKWKESSNQKVPYKSPMYLLENMIAKRKDFAESKRLFYVAGTRAVNALYWCDIELNGKSVNYGNQSWVAGIRKWVDHFVTSELAIFIGASTIKVTGAKEELLSDVQNASSKCPSFHIDNMGIVLEEAMLRGNLITLAELSVTRLSTLVTCPRKFYLKNICKITSEELDQVLEEVEYKDYKEDCLLYGADEIEIISSTNRGSDIHEQISESLETNSNCGKNEEIKNIVDWVMTKASAIDAYEFVSERPIKFSFFGHTINGIPDLVIEGEQYQIWDFKTGKRKENFEASYWFQLKAYAYAQYQLGKVEQNKSIKIVLLYVDQREVVEQITSYQELVADLKSIWKNASSFAPTFDQCKFCDYNKICH